MRERRAYGRPASACASGLEGEASCDVHGSVPFPHGLVVAIVVGYGLFYGVSTNSYLSAFASVGEAFLFVPDIFFNVVVAATVVATAGIVAVLSLKGLLKPLSLSYRVPIVLLVAVNVAVVSGFFGSLPPEVGVFVSGVVYGIGSVLLRLTLLELLAFQKPSSAIYQLALGILIGAMLAAVLPRFSLVVQAMTSCILLCAVGLCIRYARNALPRYRDVHAWFGPVRGGPARVGAVQRIPQVQRYKDAFLGLSDAIVAFWVLEAVVGLLNSFMLADQAFFEGSNSVAIVARLAALMALCLFAFAVQRIPQASTFSRVVMPVLAAMLVFLPFLSEGYSLFFNTMLLGCYYFIAMLVSYLAVEAAYGYRVSVYALMGVAMMGTRICLGIALVVGYSVGSMKMDAGGPENTLYFLIVIVVIIYMLSMAAILLSRGRKRRKEDLRWFGEPRNAGAESDGGERFAGETDGAPERDEREAGESVPSIDSDRALERRCRVLAAKGGLTEREAEIVLYLARGRTKAHIAKTLYVSENTVRSHVRNVYAKLDVHTRQELIDLLENQNPDPEARM